MELDAAYAQLAADRDATFAAARDEYELAGTRGYRDGEQRALADWVERLADAGAGQRRAQLKMRERIASIVTMAVEQIVRVQHADQLFERALSAVDRIVEGATWLRVAVSPVDCDKASVAFERLCARWRDLGRPFPLSVVADKRLAPGSCLCESDLGVIDASLATQMRAMRLAVSRALKQTAGELDGLSPYGPTALANATATEEATADRHTAELADTGDDCNNEGWR